MCTLLFGMSCDNTCLYVLRLDDELKPIEDLHGIDRWSQQSDVYIDWDKVEVEKHRRKVVSSIETSAKP